ncbi:hypothetical protein [Microbacterium sp. GXS0129]|uniref:hypothetical protein n=1 Tax=Microbacterium sp. GXS0129 TaxID=3377836 RepID=UPI00383AB825
MSVPFDPRPLLAPVDERAARAEGSMRRERDPLIARTAGRQRQTTVILLATLGPFLLLTIGVTFLPMIATAVARPTLIPALVFFLVLMAAFIAGIVALAVAVTRSARRAQDAQWYRFSRFAAANGLEFHPYIPEPPLPGLLFRGRNGTDPASENVLRGMAPRVVEFGDYAFTVSNGKSSTRVRRGYIAIRVDNLLPNIVLDAKGNDGPFGGLSLDRRQRLSLEGDFDRFFTLYCPTGYETDALYLFTPDIMLRLMTQAAVLDVELVDNWIFFYANRSIPSMDPAVWAWLFSLVHAMLTKVEQWERWRDERLAGVRPGSGIAVVPSPSTLPPGGYAPGAPAPHAGVPFAAPGHPAPPAAFVLQPPGVAHPGRRLRGGCSGRAWVIVVVALAVVVVPAIAIFGIVLGSIAGSVR